MLTRPAPLSAQCDTDSPAPGALLSSLLATVGEAVAAAFSWMHQAPAATDELPDTVTDRAKRLLRSGD